MKVYKFVLIIMLSVVATSSNATSKLSEAEQSALSLAKKFNQLFWNFENVDAGVALLSRDFSVQEPSNQYVLTPMQPSDAAKKRTFLNGMMPNLKYNIEDAMVKDDTVALFIHAEFTHTKVIKTKVGIAAPTGKKVSYKAVFKYKIDGDNISEMWMLYDVFSRDVQLGMYPELKK